MGKTPLENVPELENKTMEPSVAIAGTSAYYHSAVSEEEEYHVERAYLDQECRPHDVYGKDVVPLFFLYMLQVDKRRDCCTQDEVVDLAFGAEIVRGLDGFGSEFSGGCGRG